MNGTTCKQQGKRQGLVRRLQGLDLDRLTWLGDFAIDLVPAETETFAKDAEIGRILHALKALPGHTRRQVVAMI